MKQQVLGKMRLEEEYYVVYPSGTGNQLKEISKVVEALHSSIVKLHLGLRKLPHKLYSNIIKEISN